MSWSKICLLLVFLVNGIAGVQGQESSGFHLGDTLQLSGYMIYDKKKDLIVICDAEQRLDGEISNRKPIRKAIRKSKYVLLPPSLARAEHIRLTGKKLEVCSNERQKEYIIKTDGLLFKRYFIAPLLDEYFIEVVVDGSNYIMFKCW